MYVGEVNYGSDKPTSTLLDKTTPFSLAGLKNKLLSAPALTE